MKIFICTYCSFEEPCLLTVHNTITDPSHCPFDGTKDGEWEKLQTKDCEDEDE